MTIKKRYTNFENKKSNPNTKKVMHGRIHREICITCKQLIPLPKEIKLETPDTIKMRKIMKKYKFNQQKLSEIIGISQGTVAGWFTRSRNLQGKIKSLYFERSSLFISNKSLFDLIK